MQLDTLQVPVNWEKVVIHRDANRIGKTQFNSDQTIQELTDNRKVCQCCGRIAYDCQRFRFCEQAKKEREKYGQYGPNNVVYLGLIKRIAFFMVLCSLVFGAPLIALNLAGYTCTDTQGACSDKDFIYYWSIYNVLGSQPGSLSHSIFWLVFSVSMIMFCLYIRKYSIQTYGQIDTHNLTDSDFSIILRRLPEDTTQQQIIELIQKQIPAIFEERHQDESIIIEELKNVKVRDVLMIYRFNEILKVNQENVKKLQKYEKEKKKNLEEGKSILPFQPLPLPTVTQFGNSAIVRFHTTRECEIVADSVQTGCLQKIIQYIFPFYNPKSQYELKGEKISLEIAPDPTDIQWQNVGFTQNWRLFRKILSSFLSVFLLISSGGLSISISIWIESALKSTNALPIGITAFLSLIALIINSIIQTIIEFGIKTVRMDTFTDQQSQQLITTIINQSISLGFFSIFAPIIAKLPILASLSTSDSSTFPLVMLTTIITQSFVGICISFFLEITQIKQAFSRFINEKGLTFSTQTQACKTYSGLEVPIVSGYSHLTKIVWFGFIYGIVSPICIAIATVGISLFFLFQRLLFNYRYLIPKYGRSKLNQNFLDMIDMVPLLIGLFNLLLYTTTEAKNKFPHDQRIFWISVANIVLGLAFAVFPSRLLIHYLYNKKQPNIREQFNRAKMDITYEKCYPAQKPGVRIAIKESEATILINEIKNKIKTNVIDFFEEETASTQESICSGLCCY